MYILYFTVDGRAVLEKARVNARFIEMSDGYHPITNDSVFQDEKRMRQPVMALFDGVLPPYGATMADNDIRSLMREVIIIKRAHQTPSISRMWMRALARFLRGLMTYGFIILIWVIIIYALATSFSGG